ncbi:hypothetical protein HPP92_012554 [Vanilla planifolia]|uniref:GDSL esterase/lipase n=1 Tax=Vanilla planifolia TaxID=51239 RepID=A0A835UZ56_VANPL|nr:hypothetical protein HPP92_012554 [Vanilla planifolia]
MATSHLLLFLLLSSLLHQHPTASPQPSPSPPPPLHNISAVFAFGDSTLDTGNNNHLPTLVRADHPPYGCDFYGGVATGRFSDGRLITDYLVSSLGLKDYLPPFSDAIVSVDDLRTGVCFASAGSGLDDLTAVQSAVMTMDQQMKRFEEYLGRLRQSVGTPAADKTVADALFVVGVGSNDLMMNYYLLPTRKVAYTLQEYFAFLLDKLQSLIERLHGMGARRLTIAGLPPLGCLPLQMTQTSPPAGPRACVEQQNADAAAYNGMLQQLLQRLEASLEGAKIAYVDIYTPLMDMVTQPDAYGFVETSVGCCGTGTIEMGPLCAAPLPTCADPSKYMFWDSVHPTQAAYEALAKIFMEHVLPKVIG